MRHVDRRQLGEEKREAIRRHRPWVNPNDERKKPNKSLRISFISVVLVIFCVTMIKAPLIQKKSITGLQDAVVSQAIMDNSLSQGISRVIFGNRMLIVFEQDNVEFSQIGAKVVDDILFIKAYTRPTEVPQEPIIYEVYAEDLRSIELFVDDVNRQFDGIYMLNEAGTAIEDY